MHWKTSEVMKRVSRKINRRLKTFVGSMVRILTEHMWFDEASDRPIKI